MQTRIQPKPKPREKGPKGAPAEQSVGIRVCALSMVLLLVLAACSYVATPPAYIFVYALVAIGGSYIAYVFRNSRPAWVGILPTIGTLLLFANFAFELSFAINAASIAPPAVTAFVHMLAGLMALHCFDLRSRTDFSISALIGLGVLTFLTGVARDAIFGAYVLIYTVLGGALLFYDSSSRSHEIGPSNVVPGTPMAGEPMVRRLRVSSLGAMLPILFIPIVALATCLILPKGESMLELVIDGFRSHFPLSASMSSQVSRGGRSQSAQGGAPSGKTEGGASYTAKGGNSGGTASSAGQTDPKGRGDLTTGNGSGGLGPGAGSGPGGGKQGDKGGGGKGSAMPGFNGKKGVDFDPGDLKMQEHLAKEARLMQSYERAMMELRSAPNDLETVVLKVGSQNPTYTRRYTLDDFDGHVWKRTQICPSKEIEQTPKVGFDLTASDSVYVPPELPTEEITQEFSTEQSMGFAIPSTWMPQIIKIEGEKLRVDSDGVAKTMVPLPVKIHYTVTSQMPVYDLEVMRRLPPETLYQVDEDRADELKTAKTCIKLPGSLNPKIKDMGADAAGIEGNWFSKAERISEYVRSHYHYDRHTFYQAQPGDAANSTAYGTNASASAPDPSRPTVSELWGTAGSGPSGGSKTSSTEQPPKESDLEKFLFETKTGNCRHFASAFVVLCRTQGIPARIVVGYTPGEFNQKTGYREIKGKNTHVWAEVYIPYWNWVPFDPSPGGQLPAHQEGGNVLSKFISSGLANPFGQNVNRRPVSKQAGGFFGGGDQKKPGDGQNEGIDGKKNMPKGATFNLPLLGTIDQGQVQSVLKLIGLTVLLVVLLIAAVIYLRQQKTAKVKEMMSDYPASTLVFLEVLSELKRYDFIKQPTETADELSERARTQFYQLSKTGRTIPRELPEVVSEFMELYSQDRFGGTDNLDDLHDLSERIKELSNTKVGAKGR